MTAAFTYQGSPARIVFGNGSVGRIGELIEASGCRRALVLTTPAQASDGERLAEQIGSMAVGIFSQATMHTPIDVTGHAVIAVDEAKADCVVALGGGSTIGLAKAIAYRRNVVQIAIPTTYAGSEVTPILGQTENGLKQTILDDRVLPRVVIYDPELSRGLPVAMTVTSGLNAIAHAAEALYAKDRNPVSSLMAAEGLRALRDALPAIVRQPDDLSARGDALYGAWLCGTVLGTVGMALHHKICHTLGGSFDLPHAETHSVMLPHTIGYNAHATADLLSPISRIFGGSPGGGLYDFAISLGAPTRLRDLGLAESDLDKAADIAASNAYWNPRPVERSAIRALLQDAWEGRRPRG